MEEILKNGLNRIEEKIAFRNILGLIDLTSLEGSDNTEKIITVCQKAKSFSGQGENIPNVAAVCFYPNFVGLAKEQLADTDIRVTSVAGAFPAGQTSIDIKVAEVEYAVKQGADDIDMVISRGAFLEGDYKTVGKEIAAIKSVCQNAHLKVILETGELQTLENVRKAAEIAIASGADFIKTSTGKIPIAATLPAFFVMLEVIKETYNKTGKKIGIKPAGGISEPEEALPYYLLVKEMLGEEWLNKKLFRFGASRLADKVLQRIIS